MRGQTRRSTSILPTAKASTAHERRRSVATAGAAAGGPSSGGGISASPAIAGGSADSQAGTGGHRWTFLTNHAHVLILLDRDPTLVLRQVAAQIGITERAVQRIIADLEEGGFIEREKVGRKNHYRVLKDQPLRHPVEQHRSIGQLLDLVRHP
ncbi:MAG: winged helix-turn-helix transcriptional regulator [Pirellulales bacterium]